MTSIEQVATLSTFGSVWAVLAVGHSLAEHVFGQSAHQAANKGGAVGMRLHLATSTLHQQGERS
ncbi:hypothetical protein AB0D60_34800 [Streptomyces sp. NPDC048306]|uniref:hypothetical protein n=1 Tax=Streptomyces sp. NPDC048306 TaxID=3154502 RepID=UPI0033F0EF8A